jgi:hypothetical protein
VQRSHVSGAKIEEGGKVREWWRIDIKKWHLIAVTLGTATAVSMVLWGSMTQFVVTVLDPHVRAVVDQEVPLAMSKAIDEAVQRYGSPHMKAAEQEHGHLQQQIDEGRVNDSRIEQEIIKSTEQQTQGVRDLRNEIRELRNWLMEDRKKQSSSKPEESRQDGLAAAKTGGEP